MRIPVNLQLAALVIVEAIAAEFQGKYSIPKDVEEQIERIVERTKQYEGTAGDDPVDSLREVLNYLEAL